jgi:hypothetical protein
MRRVLVTGGFGLLSRLAGVRLLAGTRVVSGFVESRTPVPDAPATMDDFDHHTAHLDAVAGSEFVDDRIRRRE